MFEALMLVLTFLLVVSFTIQPLLTGATEKPPSHDESLETLKLRKRVVYKQIKEAEMEHEMGNLSDDDFVRIRDELKDEASRLIGEIQKRGGT